jgi:hypothetical protein
MNQKQKEQLDAIRARWDTIMPEDFARYPKVAAEQSFADVRALLNVLDTAQQRIADLEAADRAQWAKVRERLLRGARDTARQQYRRERENRQLLEREMVRVAPEHYDAIKDQLHRDINEPDKT